MESVLLGLLPILGRDNVGQRIGEIVDDALGIAGCAGGEIQQHGIRGGGLLPRQRLIRSFHLCGQIPEPRHILLDGPADAVGAGLLHSGAQLLRHTVLGGADHGVHPGHPKPVDIVADRQHMGGRKHRDAQLVQGHHGEPILIVPLQHQHHAHAPPEARSAEHVGHAV